MAAAAKDTPPRMTPEERAQLEQQIERAVRRGELADAIGHLRALAADFPDDDTVAEKLKQLEESLQPAELMSAKANVRWDSPVPTVSPVDAAERLAAKGDFAGAIAAYRKVLAAQPGSELVKERLAELFALAQARAPRRPLPPKDKTLVLSELLARIDARRRPG